MNANGAAKQAGTTIAISLLACAATAFAAASADTMLPSRPAPATVAPVTDDYFGTKVVDNYRWMEAEGVAKRADELALLLWQLGIPEYERNTN